AVSFCGETGLQKVGLGGIHPLTQRYVFGQFLGFKLRLSSIIRSVFSASWLSRNGFLNNLRLSVFKVFGLPQLSFGSGSC
ncbi:hypothetical protein ACM6WG_004418, partial [Vibrio vulnificus]